VKATKLTAELLPLITIILVIVMGTSVSVEAGSVTITDVNIDPLPPTELEPFTIYTLIDFDSIAYP
jgi:hypothetical protein